MLKLSEINIYPIKSLGGISLQSSVVEKRGLKYDRRWMMINADGDFMTQREYPQMILLQPELNKSHVIIKNKLNPGSTVKVPYEPIHEKKIEVPIWGDRCKAFTINREIDEWFSEQLGINCQLVHMPDSTERQIDVKYAQKGEIVSFADGYPFLLIGQASLDDLNSKLPFPVNMNRFRPNLVFTGGEPFHEDQWSNFRIGNLRFKAVKPCSRCVITTIDQSSANKGEEPLKTLATYRKFGSKVLFGQNVIGYDTGTIKIDDSIEIG